MLSVDPSSISMPLNNSRNIKVFENAVQISNLETSGVTFQSSNEDVITVTVGEVNVTMATATAVGRGNATITVSKGSESVTIPVTIN